MQLARKVALNDDQQTCKKAMSRHILVKNTQKKKPAAKQNPPQKKAAQLFSPTAKKGAAHKKGFHPFVCFVFLCPCFRDGISPKKQTMARRYGRCSIVMP